ncbi:Coenzyme F420:L-glutamate ligase [Candidatus Bilamarchaeum dharawalense]|uniref:Coenzyme F420:L-glutamate ligase n=1 Tax=Candidatus Bilamarchaeum dharawalense TaxID=2885759 RepID=A0A5E4LP28_9ARCH|nr:Coenzyme F420:L-glutamate ligase [Candidatus Bilamarchaeum dharawalense]
MEFYDVVQKRHSVRDFSDKPVEAIKIKNIINAAMRAPSAGNLQAYKIYLVHSQETREALLPATDYQEFIVNVPLVLVFVADHMISESKYGARGFELYSVQDATIAATYAQLAATAEGVSSVWVGAFDPLEVSRILHLMGYQVPVAILAIGYPNGPIKSTTRRPIKDMVKEI